MEKCGRMEGNESAPRVACNELPRPDRLPSHERISALANHSPSPPSAQSPTVLIFPQQPTPRIALPRELKAQVWYFTHGKCWYCGTSLNPYENLCIDHVVPLARGGGKVDLRHLFQMPLHGDEALQLFRPALRHRYCPLKTGMKPFAKISRIEEMPKYMRKRPPMMMKGRETK